MYGSINMEHMYTVKPKAKKTEYSSKLRVMNVKYNSLGVTIPKEIVDTINLNKGDLMNFTVVPATDGKVTIDIEFVKKN